MRRSLENFGRMRRVSTRIAFGALLLASSVGYEEALAQAAATMPPHSFFHVSLDTNFKEPVSGRLLLFIAPPSGDGSSVDVNMMAPTSVYIAARELRSLAPGEQVDVGADDLVFPGPLSRAAAGHYGVQAVLDIHHSYSYNGRTPGDLLSAPVSIDLPLSASPRSHSHKLFQNRLIRSRDFPMSP